MNHGGPGPSSGKERSAPADAFGDTADRQRAVAELRESEARVRALVAQVKDYAIFSTDCARRATSWNEGVKRVLGFDEAEFIGLDIGPAIFTPEAVSAGVPDEEMRVAAKEGSAGDDRWMQRKDGSRFFATGVTTAIRDPAGAVIGFSKVLRDDTARKRVEDALRQSEAQKRAVVDSSLDAIVGMDAAGKVVEWNPAAEQIFGYGRQQAIGRLMEELIITPALRERHRQGLARYLATREGPLLGQRIEMPALRSDGTEFPVELTISRIPDREPPQFTGVIRDITQRKLAEQALQDNDRRKDEFLATLAHELRNPLAPLRNSLQILRLSDDGDAAALHAMMERQVDHMVRLVDDLLEMSRISRGKIDLRKESIDLAAVVDQALETIRPAFEAAAHRLDIDLPREPLPLDADATRLTQVVANLLSNAVKYTPPGGSIRLAARREDDWAVLSVRDNGVGIPPAMLSRVFDMFTQVDRTLGRAQGGLGIGLSLVRSLVGMHGGSVEAHSDGPGKGSEFVVRLPLTGRPGRTGAPAASAMPAVPQQTGAARQRVLVVDDNRDAADSLAMLLRLVGADAQVANDGIAALASAETFAPNSVLLDLGMPGMDGFEVARRMRRMLGSRVKLIALTGWGQEEDRRRTREAGFDHHLVKPPDIAALQGLLAQSQPSSR